MEIFKLQPIFKDYIWGGQRLREDFGFQSDLPKLAEGWMLACHQAGMNTIDGGSYDGQPKKRFAAPTPPDSPIFRCSLS